MKAFWEWLDNERSLIMFFIILLFFAFCPVVGCSCQMKIDSKPSVEKAKK